MNVENIKQIVKLVINSEVAKKRAGQVIASIEEKPNGVMVYLSHGATLGESMAVQRVIKECGLSIPEQIGNAAIYVTERNKEDKTMETINKVDNETIRAWLYSNGVNLTLIDKMTTDELQEAYGIFDYCEYQEYMNYLARKYRI